MLQLLLPILSTIAGGIAGIFQSRADNAVELEKLRNERERDMALARDQQIKSFYESMDRADDPKKFTIQLWGFKYDYYKFVSIPARRYRFDIMFVLSVAYALVVCYAAIDADRVLWSFGATPNTSKWFAFMGFSLVETSKQAVYQLTLGGIILPLLSPISYTIAKYVTGSDRVK